MIAKNLEEPLIKIGKKITLFEDEIIFFEGDINYTRIHLTIGKEKVFQV